MRDVSLAYVVVPTLCLLAAACGGPGPAGAAAAPDGTGSEGFVGRAWVSDDPAAPPGRLRIFLADGTLVMDSCVETYRLARWQPAGDGRISWSEDLGNVQADLVDVTAEALRLRLRLAGGEHVEELYRPATMPFVCPDLPRDRAAFDAGLGDAIASCQ